MEKPDFLIKKIEETYIFRNAFVNYISFHWKGLLTIILPLSLLPIVLANEEKSYIALYVTLLMAFFWIFEVVPLYITGMIPMVLYPLAEILDSETICLLYFRAVSVYFMASLMAAAAIEYSNLHKRIALLAIRGVGFSLRRIHLSTMFVTFLLSAWMSNVAATVLMCPIVHAILEEMQVQGVCTIYADDKPMRYGKKQPSEIAVCLYLSLSFAATVGGNFSLIGTLANLVMKALYEASYPDSTDQITFGYYACYASPFMVIQFIIIYIAMEILFLGLWRPNSKAAKLAFMTPETKAVTKQIVLERYKELGPWTNHQIVVLISFVLMIVTFFAREPGFVDGWAEWFPPKQVENVVPTLLIIVLYFMIPLHNNCFNYFSKNKKGTAPYHHQSTILKWEILQKNVSWGLLFLFGGGFALAAGSRQSGLTTVIGEGLRFLNIFPKEVVCLLAIIIGMFLSSFSSNTAMVSIVVPIIDEVSQNLRVHPLYLILPGGLGCSMTYLFPVSTPTNAVISEYANISTRIMATAGTIPSVISISFIFLMSQTWAFVIYPDLNTFPDWANKENK